MAKSPNSRIELPLVETRTIAGSIGLQGRCPECKKWVTLIHKTKTRPMGARFHDHKGIRPSKYGYGNADCYGSPYYVREY